MDSRDLIGRAKGLEGAVVVDLVAQPVRCRVSRRRSLPLPTLCIEEHALAVRANVAVEHTRHLRLSNWRRAHHTPVSVDEVTAAKLRRALAVRE